MRNDGETEIRDDLTPASWLKFGQRNILYIGFVALLPPLGLALDGPRAAGAQSPDGFGFALTLCGSVSLGYFVVNAGLVVLDLARGRRIEKALIGCVLPAVIGVSAVLLRRSLT